VASSYLREEEINFSHPATSFHIRNK